MNRMKPTIISLDTKDDGEQVCKCLRCGLHFLWQCLSEWGDYNYHGVPDDEHTEMTLPPRCPNCGQAGEVPDGPRYDRLKDLEGRIGDLTRTIAADFEPSEKRDKMLAELRKLDAEHDAVAADLFAVKTFSPAKTLTDQSRDKLKSFVAYILLGPYPVPNVIRVQVLSSILDVLEDEHLGELYDIVHVYDPGRSVN